MNYLKTFIVFLLLLPSLSAIAEQDSSVPVEVVSAHYSNYAKAVRISGLVEKDLESSLGFMIPILGSNV